MRTLRYKSRNKDVELLEEILVKLGYTIRVNKYLGRDAERAIKDFQGKNSLVIDGIFGPKSWAKILEKENYLAHDNDKFLSENDLIDFANYYGLELAVVKAVNEIESRGKGFLISGKPKILFEGHVFWKQLQKRGIDPEDLLTDDSKNVLYKKWTRVYYLGGTKEYDRLEKAAKLTTSSEVHNAAYCSASWGMYQIMGYHYENLGYSSINDFVNKMNHHEREHMKAFGRFIEKTFYKSKNLIHWLKVKDWKKFARAYNGPSYATNKYDEKLERAYNRFS